MSIAMEAVVLAFKKIGAMTASMQTMDGMIEVVVVIGLLNIIVIISTIFPQHSREKRPNPLQ
jgi:hypothetical protein